MEYLPGAIDNFGYWGYGGVKDVQDLCFFGDYILLENRYNNKIH